MTDERPERIDYTNGESVTTAQRAAHCHNCKQFGWRCHTCAWDENWQPLINPEDIAGAEAARSGDVAWSGQSTTLNNRKKVA